MDFRIVFVCMGNICRSPTAHGVFRQQLRDAGLLHRVVVDSAGTHNYHPGRPPDDRAVAFAAQRGVDLTDLRARVVRKADFSAADLLLYMDDHNLQHLNRQCPAAHRHKLRPLTAFCRFYKYEEVPDPYTGDDEDFDLALRLIEDACEGLLEHVRAQLTQRDRLR
jgi:protein-tyrosine phosphatase